MVKVTGAKKAKGEPWQSLSYMYVNNVVYINCNFSTIWCT